MYLETKIQKEKKRDSGGNRQYTYADGGEALSLDHHVV